MRTKSLFTQILGRSRRAGRGGAFISAVFAAAIVGFAGASAHAFKPAVLYDRPDFTQDSFHRSAHEGVKSFETLWNTRIIERGARDADGERYLELVAEVLADGHDVVMGVGFLFAPAFEVLAPKHRDVRFILVDSVVSGENVRSVVFREEQGSFLVGALAGMTTRSGIVGFVGGMDSEIIRKFGCGFVQGVRTTRPGVRVLSAMVGTTGAAFNSPEAGRQVTEGFVGQGADVVYHAAGRTGQGVIAAAAAAGIFAIGVDENQNGVAPGRVLTSMVKRLDVAVYTALRDATRANWRGGVTLLGLQEGGIDWSLDENNIGLVSAERQSRIEDLTIELLSGRRQVAAYGRGSGCPGFNFGPLP